MERNAEALVYIIIGVLSLALAEAAVHSRSEIIESVSSNSLKTFGADERSNSQRLNPLDRNVDVIYNPRDDAYWPCPDPDDIAPCVCTASADDTIRDMDCSAITSDQDLVTAFSATMPFTTYRTLTILGAKSDAFTALDAFSFGISSFTKVTISDTSLQLVADGTFAASAGVLESLILSNNLISSFPFESLNTMVSLTELYLDSNNLLAANNLQSESLGMITLSNNPGLNIGPSPFASLSNLTSLYIEECGLTDFAPGTLENLPIIKVLSLARNNLITLKQESIYAPLSLWESVDFTGNPIATVEPNFLSSLLPMGKIEMSNALIIEIDETAWRPYFVALSDQSINLEGNPLRCGCDIAWLFNEATNYHTKLTSGTTCSDGTLVYNLPPDAFGYHCT